MNQLVEQNSGGTSVAVNEPNYFEQYADAYLSRNIVGKLLKFSKGDFLLGQDNKDIPAGTELVANMGELLIGWIKWTDSKPTEHLMGKMSKGFVPAKRDTLGDLDDSTWERDDRNQPRDPWQETNYLIMKPPGEAGDDDLMTFAASSKGSRDNVAELCRAYGKQVRMRGGQHPIIKLGVDYYDHPDKQYGRIKFPTFRIIGWAPATEFDNALNQAAEQAAADQAAADDKDDIPF